MLFDTDRDSTSGMVEEKARASNKDKRLQLCAHVSLRPLDTPVELLSTVRGSNKDAKRRISRSRALW